MESSPANVGLLFFDAHLSVSQINQFEGFRGFLDFFRLRQS